MTDNTEPRAPLHVVPFSHLDLFWTGTREECLSRGNHIIARALDLLDAHADFRFLIETVNFLDHYLTCYPAEKGRIRALAATGRLELAPLWSATYLNLPGGETLARNALLGQRYVREHVGATARVAHFGDLPGYTAQYPQIARLAGIEHVLLSRGGPAATPLFRWEALNGQQILAYFVPWGYALFAMHTDWHQDYAAMASGKLAELLEKHLAGQAPPSLIHWGSDLYAPNENLVLNVRRWNAEQTPQLQFSTLTEFFVAASRARQVPVLKGELPSFWPNIESSWPQLWPEDMPCEAALHMAEFLSVYSLEQGWRDYPQAELTDAWKALLDAMDHNQDCQGGDRADRDKLQLKHYSRYAAERIIDRMAWRLAAQVPIPRANMFPVVVFNSLSWRRAGMVVGRAGVFGEVRSCDINAFDAGLRLVDDTGRTLPYVTLERYEGLSVMMEIAFHAQDLPALGHRSYYLVPGPNPVDDDRTCAITLDAEADCDPAHTARYSTDRVVPMGPRRNLGSNRYENRFFRLEVDVVTGDVRVHDRMANAPLFGALSLLGVEERRGNYISSMPASGRVFPLLLDAVETVDNHAVWCRIRIRGSVYGMATTQTVTLYHDAPEIGLTNEVDWQSSRWVRIQQCFAYAGPGATIRYGVPYGFVTYPEMLAGAGQGQSDEISDDDYRRLRLCRHWVDIGDEASGVTIAADHRMWEFDGKLLRSYMVRGAGFCGGVKRTLSGPLESAAYPPSGRYCFAYTIRPRRESLAASAAYRCGWELNHRLHAVAVCGSKNTGDLPARGGLLDLTDTSLVVTAVKRAEDGAGLVIRAFEAAGQPCGFVRPTLSDRAVHETNILEDQRQAPTACSPFAIKSWLIEDAQGD